MKALLIGQDLWEVVETDCPQPVITSGSTTNLKEISSWKTKDGKALSLIILSTDNNQLSLIKKALSAKQAWKSLKDYHQKGSASALCIILGKLTNLKLAEGGDAERHLFDFEDLYDRLSALGVELTEVVKAVFILNSLPSSYKSLGSALGALSSEELTVNLVRARVVDEYLKIKEVKESDIALKVSSKYSFNCHYCKEPGHMKRDCYKLKAKSGKIEEDSRKKGHANVCATVVTASESAKKSGISSGGVSFSDFSF